MSDAEQAQLSDDVLPASPGEGVFAVLGESECAALLHDVVIGRVAFAEPSLTLLPVTFDWVEGTVVFKTSATSSLVGTVGREIAFEVDDIDEETGVGWSVVARGVVERGTPEQAGGIVPWAAGQRDVVLTLRPRELSGRVVSRPENPEG